MSKNKDKEVYSRQFPEIEKWLNHCIVCGTSGYKPELPEKIYPGNLAENIRKFYTPLAINELNMCEQCSTHYNKANNQLSNI